MALARTEAGVWVEIEKRFFNDAVPKEHGYIWTKQGLEHYASCGLDVAPAEGSTVSDEQVGSWKSKDAEVAVGVR